MNNSTTIASILLAAILTNNMVLSKFLGICPFLGVSKKTDTAFSMGVAVTLVMVVATAVTWPIYHFILAPSYTYLETIVFILVIAAIVQLIETVLKKYIKPLYNALGILQTVLILFSRFATRWARGSASCLRCCCFRACASALRQPIYLSF